VRKSLTRVVVPVVGLLAVTTALALVGIAPILIFPPSKDAGPRPIPPSASSEVASVAAPAVQPNGGSGTAGGAQSTGRPADAGSATGRPVSGPNPHGGGGTMPQPGSPEQPGVDRPDEVAREGDGSTDVGKGQTEDEGKGQADEADGHGKPKTKNGKALGHSKDKAKGNAKGHEKWQGQAPVASPPHGPKPGHVHPSPAPKHSGGGHRPHARSRG
jgi:hypothetical protein